MAGTSTQQFEMDPVLSGIAIAYRNPDYALIADEVLPRTPAPDRDFKYTVYDEDEQFRLPDTRIGRRSAPNRVELSGSLTSVSVEDFGIDIPLDNATINQGMARGRNVRGAAVERGANIVLLDREVRVAGVISNVANYHADQRLALSGSSMFSDPTSDPVGAIMGMLDSCWMRPNQLTIGQAAWAALRVHPKIVSSVNRNNGTAGVVTRDAVAALFEVQRVLVGAGRINIAKPGLAPSIARTWGAIVAGQFIDRSVAIETGGMTFGFTAELGSRVAGSVKTDMGLDGGELVRTGERVKELIVARRAGFLISNAA